MNLLKALGMGLLQGLTEFLPVSSSGHLAIFKCIFHVDTGTGIFFDVLLHVGTLISVFVAFWDDIVMLFKEGIGILVDFGHNLGVFFHNCATKEEKYAYEKVVTSSYRKFVMLVIVATIPTGIMGIAGKDFVEVAGESLLVPGIGLIVTALVLFVADRCKGGKKLPSTVTYLEGFITGMVQGIATLPGVSRSGSTIAACLLLGFEKKFAVKYSFIMSVPAILGAAVLELKDVIESPPPVGEIPMYLAGMVVAAIVGFICIKTMMIVVRNNKFTIFSIYCLIAGIVCLVAHFK